MSLLTQWMEENVGPPEPEFGYRFLDITPLYEWAAENKVLFTKDRESEALRIYEMREKVLSDWTSGINHARREGVKEIARKMKDRGRPFEEIAEDTGLDVESIEKL